MSSDHHHKILVTGATGNVGRHVVTQLRERGIPVLALTRNPGTANLPADVETLCGDLTSLATGLVENVEAVFLVWRSGDTKAAPALIETLAKRARRIVFLSSSAVQDGVPAQSNPIGQLHADVEHLIENSGVEWTFLRPGGFATNARSWTNQIRHGDTVRWPYAEAAAAPIHERDIASVAVRALTESRHNGAKYVLSGPQSLTQAEQVRLIGEAVGRPLRFEEISPEEARPLLLAQMPAPVADLLLHIWPALMNNPAPVTGTVPEITGAPARSFRQWAIDHAEEFRRENANPLPDIARPDAHFVMVREWKAGTPERQQALAAEWERSPWPQGLLSVNLYSSTDGEVLLSYAQWANSPQMSEQIESSQEVVYRLYRSGFNKSDTRIPGCVVIVSVEFDAPDPQRQRAWIDTVFEALDSETNLPSGGISGHFHVSVDGTRVLNYAEWTDEEAHRQAIENSGQGAVGKGPLWRRVQSFPGLKSSGFRRYHFLRSLTGAR